MDGLAGMGLLMAGVFAGLVVAFLFYYCLDCATTMRFEVHRYGNWRPQSFFWRHAPRLVWRIADWYVRRFDPDLEYSCERRWWW